MKKNPNISIIIITYNCKDELPRLFSSLREQTYAGKLNIIAVDNNSHDGSQSYLLEHEKNVTLLPQTQNFGFAGGMNIGIDEAVRREADAVVLLNTDMYVDKHFLVRLVAGAYSSDTIATAQPLLLLMDNPEIINSAGNIIHYLGFGYTRNYKKHFSSIKGKGIYDTAYASGAALLIKTPMLQKYGKLIDDYFMYHEDLEFGYRMLMVGKRNVVVPSAYAFHDYSFEKSIRKFYYMERNRHRFVLTHYSLKFLMLILPIYIVTELALLIASVFTRTFFMRLRVHAYFLRFSTWKKIFHERKKVQTLRTKNDTELAPLFIDGVYFQDVNTLFARYIANPMWSLYWKLIKRFI